MISFECPNCKSELTAIDNSSGQICACESCGTKVRIPQIDTELEVEFQAASETDSAREINRENPSVASPMAPPTVTWVPRSPTENSRQQLAVLPIAIACATGGFIVGGLLVGLIMNASTKPNKKAPQADVGVAANQRQANQKPEPIKKPRKLPELFKAQVLTYIKSASRLNSLATQGPTYRELTAQIITVRADLEIVESSWPADLDKSSLKRFQHSMRGFELAHELWSMRMSQHTNPTEPNINMWEEYMSYAGDKLTIAVNPNDELTSEDERGKRFVPFEPNITILLRIGIQSSSEGRTQLLSVLE